MAKKILLTGVFGPFGVDDAFGRKENVMELFHNQVTKAQGIASLRFHHRSFGLYFLAENVDAPVTVLDFPTREQFIRLLKSERFDAVGIGFIVPNFVKAREMARLVRELQPQAEIILGGHGAAIEGIERLIECDHVVKGEGIRWMREWLGEPSDAPIRHPALISADHKRIFGVPAPGVAGLLVPGVGCVNGCRFCATSHFFQRKYTPYFAEGEELYRQACGISDELHCDEFFVMDENFLKSLERAKGMLACMERDRRPFKFGVFSSAEAIESFGVENLARLGVYFIWIGAESKRETYDKNKGRDLKGIIRRLRDHGVSVLVSGILFLEHHTPENIQEDIDYIIDLEGDFTQFMLFTPLPGTALYKQYKQDGRLDLSMPWEEVHGQHQLNFAHPSFRPEQADQILRQAFQLEFDRLSSSIYRMADTTLRGIRTLEPKAAQDPWLALRLEQLRERAKEMRLILPTMKRFAHDALERERLQTLGRTYQEVLWPQTLKDRGLALGARLVAESWALRSRLFGDLTQPQSRLTRYRWQETTQESPLRVPELAGA